MIPFSSRFTRNKTALRRIHCMMPGTQQLILRLNLLLLAGTVCLSGQTREIWERHELGVVGHDARSAPWGAYQEGFKQAMEEAEAATGGRIAFTLSMKAPGQTGDGGQMEVLRQLFIDGIQGIGLEVDPLQKVGPMLEFLREREVPVVLFGQGEAQADVLAQVRTDNVLAGRMLLESASSAFGQRRVLRSLPALRTRTGQFAVLAGPSSDPVVQSRLRGLQQADEEDTSVRIIGVYHHNGTLGGAIRLLRETEEADRDRQINGWILLDSLAMASGDRLPWERGTKICVAMDASPQTLRFIANGYAQFMVARNYPEIALQAGRVLTAKVHGKQDPEEKIIRIAPLLVSPDNVDVFSEKWTRWLR